MVFGLVRGIEKVKRRDEPNRPLAFDLAKKPRSGRKPKIGFKEILPHDTGQVKLFAPRYGIILENRETGCPITLTYISRKRITSAYGQPNANNRNRNS